MTSIDNVSAATVPVQDVNSSRVSDGWGDALTPLELCQHGDLAAAAEQRRQHQRPA